MQKLDGYSGTGNRMVVSHLIENKVQVCRTKRFFVSTIRIAGTMLKQVGAIRDAFDGW
jgi:hypothetical protein